MRTILRAAVIVGLLALSPLGFRTAAAAGPTTKIVVTPATPTIISGQTQAFTVMAYAADNTAVDVTDQTTFSANDPLGSFTTNVYTAGKIGAWTVQASFQSFTATATVTVTPGAVKDIVVNPNSEPEQTTIGTNAKFTATAYDAKNNIIANQAVTWSVLGTVGTIDAQGIFVPKTIGTGKVQAAVGDVVGQVSVAVNAAPVVNTNTAPVVKNTNTTNSNTVNTNTAVVTKDDTTNETTSCTTLRRWAWTLLLVIFLLATAILYALVPVTKIWPVAAALAVAAVLSFVQRKYDCTNGQAWWAWVMMIGTLALSAVALQLRPKNTPSA